MLKNLDCLFDFLIDLFFRRQNGGLGQRLDLAEQRSGLPQQRRQLTRDSRPEEHARRLHPRRPRHRRRPRSDRDRNHLQKTSTQETEARRGGENGCEKVERNH